jgi:hypothetical protein
MSQWKQHDARNSIYKNHVIIFYTAQRNVSYKICNRYKANFLLNPSSNQLLSPTLAHPGKIFNSNREEQNTSRIKDTTFSLLPARLVCNLA